MSLTGVTFSNQKVTPSDDGRLYSSMLSDGILTGCGITFTAATLSIAAGSLLVGGRELRTSGETLSVTGATSGFARVLIDIDLTKAATKDSFEQAQWLIQYAASTDAFAALETQDINSAGTHFQAVFCVLSLGSAGIASVLSSMGSASASLSDGSVSLAKLANNAKYWDETARTNTDELGIYITRAWGHLLNYCWGTNQEFSMDGPEYARLDTFWESILFAADAAITVTLTAMPAIVNAETGESYGTTKTFTVPKGRTLWLKKISTAVMLVGGSFARPNITAGTADPTGGNDGDIYIQYSE